MRRAIIAAAMASMILATPAVAQGNTGDGLFVSYEYWRCAPENVEALNETYRTVWQPIFAALIDEGIFIGHGQLISTSAERRVLAPEVTIEQVEPDHQMMAWFVSASEEASEAAWDEFDRRLLAQRPDDPRPFLYCDQLTIVNYGN